MKINKKNINGVLGHQVLLAELYFVYSTLIPLQWLNNFSEEPFKLCLRPIFIRKFRGYRKAQTQKMIDCFDRWCTHIYVIRFICSTSLLLFKEQKMR